MSEARDICLILWADRFDEAVAVVFAVELRRIGLPVRLVKLPGVNYTGLYGFTLTPDISLNEALAMLERVACILVPTDSPAIGGAANDPRVETLWTQARQQQIEVIAGAQAAAVLAGSDSERGLMLSRYGEGAALYQQAGKLAQRISRQPVVKAGRLR